jgi:hypothetical protein
MTNVCICLTRLVASAAYFLVGGGSGNSGNSTLRLCDLAPILDSGLAGCNHQFNMATPLKQIVKIQNVFSSFFLLVVFY